MKKAVSLTLSLAFEVLVYPIGIAIYPLRVLFFAISRLSRGFLLLCRRKYAKMRDGKVIKRYTSDQIVLASVAFLPSEVREGSGVSQTEGRRNGRDQKNPG